MKNKVILYAIIVIIIIAIAIVGITFNKNNEGDKDVNGGNENYINADYGIDEASLQSKDMKIDVSDFEFASETIINLSEMSVNGQDVSISEDANGMQTIEINNGGAYRVTGTLENGRIVVNAKSSDVNLILDNATIKCLYSAPIYVFESSDTMITLEDGTTNTISDGNEYSFDDKYSSSADEEPNACLYSKSDLIIYGNGTLNVIANNNNGITSKDTLYIENASISVNAKNHGINGKDSNTIKNAKINVTAGGDGIRATNDTDTTLGWIRIEDSEIIIEAGEDGIQAKTDLIINGGEYTLKTNDDGIHADNTVMIDNGNIDIQNSYEGIEGINIVINGGNINIVALDDGINVNGGNDFSGFGNFDKGMMGGSNRDNVKIKNMSQTGSNMKAENSGDMKKFGGRNQMEKPEGMDNMEDIKNFENIPDGENPDEPQNDSNAMTDSEGVLIINGGSILINAAGDGLDSNGSIIMNGGTVIVHGPTNSGNGALDYAKTFEISGGELIAVGASGMAQAPSSTSSQTYISANVQTQKENSEILLKDSNGNEIVKCTSLKTFSNVVISSSKLEKGKTYELYINGTKITDVTAGQGSSGNQMGKRR